MNRCWSLMLLLMLMLMLMLEELDGLQLILAKVLDGLIHLDEVEVLDLHLVELRIDRVQHIL